MRFEIGQQYQGTSDPSMRAEVIEVRNDGRDATPKLLKHGGETFELNVGGVMIGNHHWRLVP